jgi:hypothetical protein
MFILYFEHPRPHEGVSWSLQLASELTGGESWCFWVKKLCFWVDKTDLVTVHRESLSSLELVFIELGDTSIEFGVGVYRVRRHFYRVWSLVSIELELLLSS